MIRAFANRLTHKPLQTWLTSLGITFGIGVVAMVIVLAMGLQVTGLNDRVPVGIMDHVGSSSIALGAGAFTFSTAVYLFRIKNLEVLARPAVFIGFLGYSSAMIALAMDIGRPDHFWHPIVFWNVHSVLWEVTWCVILYSTVLVLEVLGVIRDSRLGKRWPRLQTIGHISHRLTPILAIIGMGLSLLHQSSLGATYGVLSGRAIWYKPSLPVMFIISAIGGGMSLTMLASMIVGRLRRQQFLPPVVCVGITKTIGFITLGYLYMKIWDLGGHFVLQPYTCNRGHARTIECHHALYCHLLGYRDFTGWSCAHADPAPAQFVRAEKPRHAGPSIRDRRGGDQPLECDPVRFGCSASVVARCAGKCHCGFLLALHH